MNVLIVKLTSMGDLIHALPALTDAMKHMPNIRFDWVADETFADIPRMHPGVDKVIVTAHRRWKKQLWQTLKSGELLRLWREIRQKKYDLVIDAQGSLKSAIIMRLARGVHCGVDKDSAREKIASWFCERTFSVPSKQHAIDRVRQLFAKALDYPIPDSAPDFNINLEKLPELPIDLPKPYLVFVHSTTWNTKHWPEHYWEQLIKIAAEQGYTIALPWGGAKEQERAQRLAKSSLKAIVLPRLSIPQQARMIAQSNGAVCVDTGLGHLTAALNIPAVHLYGPTDPALIGATGQHQLHLIAEYECAPCYLHDCLWGQESACFLKNMRPEKVWEYFSPIIIK